MLETMTLSSPKILLIREDFPTFGFPTTAILGISSSSSFCASSSKCSTTFSSISPNPNIDAAEIGTGSPIPKL